MSNPVFNCSLPCSQPISYSSNEVFVVTTPSVAAYQAAGYEVGEGGRDVGRESMY